MGRAAFYVFERALEAGKSCTYDANINQVRHRQDLTGLAGANGAEFCLLWFDVPQTVAVRRARERAEVATGDWKDYYQTFGPDFVQEMQSRIAWPSDDEQVIKLDGEANYDTQRNQVLMRLKRAS